MDGKLERFARGFAEHKVSCGGGLKGVPVLHGEGHETSMQLTLSCEVCGYTFRELFTYGDVVDIQGRFDEAAIEQLVRDCEKRAVN